VAEAGAALGEEATREEQHHHQEQVHVVLLVPRAVCRILLGLRFEVRDAPRVCPEALLQPGGLCRQRDQERGRPPCDEDDAQEHGDAEPDSDPPRHHQQPFLHHQHDAREDFVEERGRRPEPDRKRLLVRKHGGRAEKEVVEQHHRHRDEDMVPAPPQPVRRCHPVHCHEKQPETQENHGADGSTSLIRRVEPQLRHVDDETQEKEESENVDRYRLQGPARRVHVLEIGLLEKGLLKRERESLVPPILRATDLEETGKVDRGLEFAPGCVHPVQRAFERRPRPFERGRHADRVLARIARCASQGRAHLGTRDG